MSKQFKNIFYSYSMDELKGFSRISRLSKGLAQVPSDIDEDFFYKKLKDDSYFQARNEIYKPPVTDLMLAREARSTLLKNKPQLKKIISKDAAKNTHKKPNHSANYLGHFGMPMREETQELQEEINRYFDQPCKLIGDFLYPKGGYRGWHTNKYEGENWSMFLIHVDESKKSFFRFMHPNTGEILTIWDYPNSVNFFRTGSEPLLWHCIASETTNRWSKGYLVPDTWADWT